MLLEYLDVAVVDLGGSIASGGVVVSFADVRHEMRSKVLQSLLGPLVLSLLEAEFVSQLA